MFLLFLDCVYQLTVQYPSAFEFSEIYLISLWDSCGTGLFREFIFNSNKDRKPAKQKFSEAPSTRLVALRLQAVPAEEYCLADVHADELKIIIFYY